MITEYEFRLTEYEKANGVAPQLLTQAKSRARMVAMGTMQPNLTEAETALRRGVYKEIQSLIAVLEKAGVSDAHQRNE